MNKIILKPTKKTPYPVRQYTDKEIDEFLKEDKKTDPKILEKLQDIYDGIWLAKNESKLKTAKGKTGDEIAQKYKL